MECLRIERKWHSTSVYTATDNNQLSYTKDLNLISTLCVREVVTRQRRTVNDAGRNFRIEIGIWRWKIQVIHTGNRNNSEFVDFGIN